MLTVIFTLIFSMMFGYGIYAEAADIFLAGFIGFIALLLNLSMHLTRALDYLSFLTCLSVVIYGGYLIYMLHFAGV